MKIVPVKKETQTPYLSKRRSVRVRGSRSISYSDAGIVRKIHSSPEQNNKNTPMAAVNSHLESGNPLALYFLSVGVSASHLSSLSNTLTTPASAAALRGAAMEIDGDGVDGGRNRLLGSDERLRISNTHENCLLQLVKDPKQEKGLNEKLYQAELKIKLKLQKKLGFLSMGLKKI
ncbi:UvrABC system protein A [Striga asiatica]|uniref:UvrABC system protein A n=1 Tax=Striga asiatica TaxID=4170 RepID=A0A5A7P4N0_STRAF|nr:UvrABC system protein A [Striga asiatica]